MKIANSENFTTIIESEKPVLVDFWAEWCGPCKMLIPIIEELSEELADKIDIYKCNVDESPDIAGNFNIKSIPTLIIFKNKEIVDMSVGAGSKASVKQWIESNI